jgi:hypothetical protein
MHSIHNEEKSMANSTEQRESRRGIVVRTCGIGVAATLGLALLLASTFIAGATQEKPRSDAAPTAPARPGIAEMKRLAFYLGDWTYTENYPNGAKNTGVYASKLGPGGNSLVNTFSSHGPVGNFEGMLVFTWDLNENKYKAYAFAGAFPGAIVETGEFEGDRLVFRGEISAGGKKLQIRNATWLTASGQLVSEEYMSSGGSPEKLLVRVEATKQ